MNKKHIIYLSNIAGSTVTNVFNATRMFWIAGSSVFFFILFTISIKYYVSFPGFLDYVF
jgi:hypothetical protein